MILTPPTDGTVHQLLTSTVWFREDGIMRAVSKKGIKRTEEIMKKSLEELVAIFPDEKICAIIDVTNSSENTRKARQYASQNFPKYFKAIAVVSGSSFGKMVANIFITIKTPPFPMKFFNSEEAAISWLKQLQ